MEFTHPAIDGSISLPDRESNRLLPPEGRARLLAALPALSQTTAAEMERVYQTAPAQSGVTVAEQTGANNATETKETPAIVKRRNQRIVAATRRAAKAQSANVSAVPQAVVETNAVSEVVEAVEPETADEFENTVEPETVAEFEETAESDSADEAEGVDTTEPADSSDIDFNNLNGTRPRHTWRDDRSCIGQESMLDDPVFVSVAKKMCKHCIVCKDCLEDDLQSGVVAPGVRGGFSHNERAMLLKRYVPTPTIAKQFKEVVEAEPIAPIEPPASAEPEFYVRPLDLEPSETA